MTLAFNLIFAAVLCAGLLVWWKTKKHWVLAVTAMILLLYAQIQPSYLPKSTAERSAPPPFSESSATIEDRTRKPASLEERDQRTKEAIKGGLDFKN